MYTACMLGFKFSIIDVLNRTGPQTEELLNRYGMKAKCASIRAVELPVLEIESKSDSVLNSMIEAAELAIHQNKAEVLILGSAGMAGLDKRIENKVGVPVLDGVACAVKMAEAIVDLRLSHSKIAAFKFSEKKEYRHCLSPPSH